MIASLILSGILIVPAPQAVHTEYRAAVSTQAKDMMGWEPSLYRGKWWDAKWYDIRRCIMDRESNFNYRAANRTSSAKGAYQFLDNNWRRGLVYMMVKESKETGDGLETQAERLFTIPISKWNRYWQDRAFYTALQGGKGLKHWNAQVPGTGCW